MAAITLLTPDQLAERSKPKGKGRAGRRRSPERTQVIAAYQAAMQAAHPGLGAEVVLTEEETKRRVRQDLKVAARALDLALDFRPQWNQRRLLVRFITPQEHAAQPKPGGRPRKAPPAAPGAAAGAAPPGAGAPADPLPAPHAPPPPAVQRRPRKLASSAA